ncbi:hypothetical protein MAR_016820 [Mya arenaria]|uniref:Uncharacterized protein n=1 Tax=Mya arenaria TaxID=6604 RepID=A0ABY7E9Z6_MYAAR|nr:hypothetical protein MAR_016820 [Mya arenaria]
MTLRHLSLNLEQPPQCGNPLEIISPAMAFTKSLVLVVVLVALTLTSAGRRRRVCRMDGAQNCVEVKGRRGVLKGVGLCQNQGGICMHFIDGGAIKCACIEVKQGSEVNQGSVKVF